MKIRVGFGYDVHQLKEGEELFLGGIRIEHTKGTVGYSDGDVLIHAICDALLGAANLRDIGYHFPDTEKEFDGIDSRILLKRTYNLLKYRGYAIGNIDSTICLEKPKIKDHIGEMCAAIADTLNISIEDVSIKATTTEQLGFVGSEDGVSAYATVLIERD